MQQAVRFLEKLAPGCKLALTLSIPVLGLLWLIQGEVWRSVGLKAGIAIVTLVTLSLAIKLGIALLRAQCQLGAAPAHLREIAEAMAGGNLDMDLATDYPASGVYAAMQSIQRDLRHRVVADQEALVELTRIKQALNSVGTIVLVGDLDANIAYINRAGTVFFREAAADIRKSLPGFNADKLHGKCIGLFHTNPLQQRRMLADLDNEYRTEIKLGGRTFTVIASPVFSEGGERLGVVAEWTERTAELAVERDVQRVVDSAFAGDLGQRILLENKSGVCETLSKGVNEVVGLADQVITDTVLVLGALTTSADEIARGNTNLRRWAKRQAASLKARTCALANMRSIASRNGDRAADVAELSTTVRRQAENGVSIVGQTLTAIKEINTAARKVADIIYIVDEIASQISVLALNTSLEVALAGDKESVFAVVADEMRNLAGRSATAAQEMKALIEDSIAKIDSGTRLVNASGESLAEIADEVKKVTDVIGGIAAVCKEQVADINGKCQTISRLDHLAQQHTAPVKQAAAATNSLKVQLQELEQLVRFFTKNGGTAISAASPNSAPAGLPYASAPRPRAGVVRKKTPPHLTLLKFPSVACPDD